GAGIVGMGGAGFPTHIKLSPPKEARVDTLILNGAECEPYLTTDQALMREKAREVLEGARIIMRILGVGRCLVGIEENKPDAIERMTEEASALKGAEEIEVVRLKTKYPQGSEKQLIQALIGRKVPAFGLPFDVGVVVQNVATTYAVYEACVLQKPLFERVVTVSGRAIKRPANLLVKVGTKISHIAQYLGVVTEELRRIVIGGPMMGFSVPTMDLPVTKTTSGILFLTEEEIDERPHRACIRCGFCLEACPMGLMPNEIGIYVEAGRASDTGEFGVFECFECGSCAYVCPAKRPLVQFIRFAKSKAKR
ncbi:MAG: electron transport complex subunit RsxC, partial [Desulfatiglandales bacterium]